MRVWGVAMFANEVDVAYHVLMHMAEEGLAGIVVADNLSDDGTRAELERAQADLADTCPVLIQEDPVLGYWQSRKMTALAAVAADAGAEWVVPFDADELWFGKDRIRVMLEQLPPECAVATARLFNHFPTSIDPDGDNPFRTIAWRQVTPAPLPKVAFRWHGSATVEQGNHAVTFAPGLRDWLQDRRVLEVRHFPYRSYEQFRSKAERGARAYAATNLPATMGTHWRQYGAILDRHGDDGPLGLRAVFEKYFRPIAPVEAGLVFDPAPFRRWHKEQDSEPAPPADKEAG